MGFDFWYVSKAEIPFYREKKSIILELKKKKKEFRGTL